MSDNRKFFTYNLNFLIKFLYYVCKTIKIQYYGRNSYSSSKGNQRVWN